MPQQYLMALALPLLSALLLALCFTQLACASLAWVALVPLAVAVRLVHSPALLYLGAGLAGAVFHLATLDWVRTSYQGQWLSGDKAAAWLVMGLGLAPTMMLAVWLLRRPALACIPFVVCLPLIWTTAEFVRWHYPRIVTGMPFPWLQLGLIPTQHDTLCQIADLGGVWLITALVALVNGALADCISPTDRSVRRTLLAISLAVIALWATHEYGRWRLAQPLLPGGPCVCLMPASSSDQLLIPDSSASLGDATPQYPADLLLWSETVLDQVFTSAHAAGAQTKEIAHHSLADNLRRYAAARGTPLIVGCRRVNGSARFNSLVFAGIDSRGASIIDWYDKAALVPWSEYRPGWMRPFMRDGSAHYQFGDRYVCFEIAGSSHQRAVRVAPLICYDACFPAALARYFTQAQPAPPDLIALASCETSDRTGVAATTMLRIARLRAIEFRRPIARNAEGGASCLIDSCGRVLACTNDLESSGPMLLPAAPLDTRRTLYAQLGDWFPLACLLVLAALEVAARGRYARSRSSNRISATNSATLL